jgi:hypothetical protein
MNVFALMRAEGVSHVRPATCWEFLRNLAYYRFGEGRKALEVPRADQVLTPLPAESGQKVSAKR